MCYDKRPDDPPSLTSVAAWLARNDWCKEARAVRNAKATIARLTADLAAVRAELDELRANFTIVLRARDAALRNAARQDEQLLFAGKVVSAARQFMADNPPCAMPASYHRLKSVLYADATTTKGE